MAKPQFINDGGFKSAIFLATDDVAAPEIGIIWDQMGLPTPEDGEYLHGDHGVQVFLNPYGLLLNFRSRLLFQNSVYDSRVVQHDNVLQPLYRRDLSKETSFEICPGVRRAGASLTTIDALATRLKSDGINFYDRDPGYVGVLPSLGKTKLVVANRSAIRVKARSVQTSQSMDTQTQIFGALSEQMSEAFASASNEKIQAAFGVCADIVSLKDSDPQRILHDSWIKGATLGPRRDKIVAGASAYARRLAIP